MTPKKPGNIQFPDLSPGNREKHAKAFDAVVANRPLDPPSRYRGSFTQTRTGPERAGRGILDESPRVDDEAQVTQQRHRVLRRIRRGNPE